MPFKRGDRLGEHALVRRCPRGGEIGSGARQRERDGLACRLRLALFRRQRAAQLLAAFFLRLLEFDILTLEPSGHSLRPTTES